MSAWVTEYWPLVFATIERTVAVVGCAHVALHKRDGRAATLWIGLILFSPLIGIVLYTLFGINRLQRRGGKLQNQLESALALVRKRLDEHLPHRRPRRDDPGRSHPQLVQLVSQLTRRALLPGNKVEPLRGGEQAYPAMIEAIENAQHTIGLCSYIFDRDRAGRQFVDALAAAHQRGVAVRILVDDMGARYSPRSAVRLMRKRGLHCRTFLPAFARRTLHLGNLRNHRKVLTVDGRTAFTGGMNIREHCRLDWNPSRPVRDMHFRVTGPVVFQVQETFAADWLFATGELLIDAAWFPDIEPDGDTWCRGISDGPDEDFEKMLITILGATGAAQRRVDILTPYFLPGESTIHALSVAALRGVKVRIVLPQKSNNWLVQWASWPYFEPMLERGCELYLSPPPFDHSKLMLIDDNWSLIGSTNWDPRSLRLNFEFNVECYQRQLNQTLGQYVEDTVARSQPVSMQQVRARSMPVRLRDGLARLLTPYL